MSFGVGVGDFIAVITLAFKVCEAIRGSPAEHHELALQLNTFRDSLEDIHRLVLSLQLSKSETRSAGQQLSRSFRLLQDLDEVSKKYIKGGCLSLREPNKGKAKFNELRWGFYKRDEFIQLLDEFKGQMCSLDRLLNIYNTRMAEETRVVHGNVKNAIPKPLDQFPDQDYIRFTDALDRNRVFPFEYCNNWEKFERFLKLSFEESAGKSWVDAGRYEILDETKGTILTAKEWGSIIKPGMALSMSMLLQKQRTAKISEHNCPSCDFPYTGATTEDLKRVRCMKCAVWFQISSKPRIEELGQDDFREGDWDGSTGGTVSIRSTKANEQPDANDLRFFRRLHVLLEISKHVNPSVNVNASRVGPLHKN